MDIIFCSRVENLQRPECAAPKGEKQNCGSYLIITAFFCSLIRVFPASNFTILEKYGERCSQSVSGEKKGSLNHQESTNVGIWKCGKTICNWYSSPKICYMMHHLRVICSQKCVGSGCRQNGERFIMFVWIYNKHFIVTKLVGNQFLCKNGEEKVTSPFISYTSNENKDYNTQKYTHLTKEYLDHLLSCSQSNLPNTYG